MFFTTLMNAALLLTLSTSTQISERVPEEAWAAMNQRVVVVRLSDGAIYEGEVASQNERTVTIIANDGAVAVIHKDNVIELRVITNGKQPPSNTGTPSERVSPVQRTQHPAAFQGQQGYLHVSPGVLSFELIDPTPLYQYSVGGGGFISRERIFALSFGGVFEHLVGKKYTAQDSNGFITVRARPHIFRIAAEARIGARSNRIFGYGLARVGASIFHVQTYDGLTAQALFGMVATAGAGVQGLLGQRFILGAEPAFDFDILGVRNPEIAEDILVIKQFRARVFFGFLF